MTPRRRQLDAVPPVEAAAGAALMTVQEAAGVAFLGEAEIRYLVTIGEIESVLPPGRRTPYIPRRAFRAWLRARAQAAAARRSGASPPPRRRAADSDRSSCHD